MRFVYYYYLRIILLSVYKKFKYSSIQNPQLLNDCNLPIAFSITDLMHYSKCCLNNKNNMNKTDWKTNSALFGTLYLQNQSIIGKTKILKMSL